MTTSDKLLSKEEIYRRCHVYAEFDLVPNKESTIQAMDMWAEQVAIRFFSWYILKMTGFLEYLRDIKPIVTSNEIEENLINFEGKSFKELYQLYLKSLTQ